MEERVEMGRRRVTIGLTDNARVMMGGRSSVVSIDEVGMRAMM